ncbi:hypothetical protein VNO77_02701 [Canavalia gladiata]|uniref:Uncharacterized protein n=1 Tax=Canavalia gladiata TaxID=3824 RepID=A0AAN9R658_CANGL
MLFHITILHLMNHSSASPDVAEAVSEVLFQRLARTLWLTHVITGSPFLLKEESRGSFDFEQMKSAEKESTSYGSLSSKKQALKGL